VFSLNILFRFRRWARPDSVCPCSAEMERGFRRFLFGGPEAAVVPILRSPGFRDGSRLRGVVVRPVCIFRLRRRGREIGFASFPEAATRSAFPVAEPDVQARGRIRRAGRSSRGENLWQS